MNKQTLHRIMPWGAAIAAFSFLHAEEFGEYVHLRLGAKYAAEKNYDKAIAEFRKSLSDYPENYNVYVRIAEIRMRQGLPRLAIADLKQALSYNPGWGKAHDMLAQAYTMDNQLQKAIEEYQYYQQSCDPTERDSVQRVIDKLVAHIGLGTLLRGDESGFGGGTAGPPREASRVSPRPAKAKNAIPAIPSDPRAAEAFKRAIAAYHSGSYDTALAQLKHVITFQPGFTGAYYFGGLARYAMGHYKQAKMNLEKGIGYPDPACTALLYLGKLNGAEGNYSDAVEELSRYLKFSNSESGKKEAAELLSRYRSYTGKEKLPADSLAGTNGLEGKHGADGSSHEISIDSSLAMITVDTLSDAGQKLLSGIREFQADRFDQAIREFKKTLTAYPTGPVAVQCKYNIGICYFKLRLYAEAENQFQQILDRYPGHVLAARALFLKASSYYERKETTIAERLLREFLNTHRGHAWESRAWEKLGDLYLDLDQPKKSIDAFAHIIATEVGGSVARAYFVSGVAYQSLGNSIRAVACFDSAISRGERSGEVTRVPDSYYRAADETYKGKDYKRALAYYTGVTRKYPSFQETPWGLFQIGTIHKNLHAYQAAIDTYKELMRRFPEDYWAGQARWKLDDAVWENEYKTTTQ